MLETCSANCWLKGEGCQLEAIQRLSLGSRIQAQSNVRVIKSKVNDYQADTDAEHMHRIHK